MLSNDDVFQRVEKKYVINSNQFNYIVKSLSERTVPDEHGEGRICNIYFDTPDYRLIRRSLMRPVYKEKLRLRGYGDICDDSEVFVEIKRKFEGTVYKRRIELPYKSAREYLSGSGGVECENQISHEIDWFKSFYSELEPKMYISYKRIALYDKLDHNLRITFDSGILWRNFDLDLRNGSYGAPLLNDGEYVMEIKLKDAIPLWLSKILTKGHIFHTSYSKYGNAFLVMQQHSKNKEKTVKITDGGIDNA